ncbi:putative receptor-like protein kinase At3g47110 isoform X2 [Quercus suber]|uniref:putative receptor-like protein kinase At3g47110 isoform X2 n=1 Tax=Quercus suber TaxID=58331 RepID=UPI0032DF909F
MKRQAMSLRLLCSIQFQTILLFLVVLLHVETLSIFGISTASSTYFVANETDHHALLSFKTQITRAPENVFSSWNDSLHFCEWKGVTCGRKHRRVTVLNLRSSGLVGSLSPYIGNLSFIREIVLANNTIGGKIPDEVGRLFRLQLLWLSNNSFQGEIPANLSHCSNLYHLEVGGNNLSGSIPKELAFLSKLEFLDVHANNLSGGIPPFIGNISSLQVLAAAKNVLDGHIPDALGQLRSLTFLGFGGNKLSGLIPPSLYNLSSIIVFSLGGNELIGSLPTDLFLTLPHLQWFQMAENQLTGSLPISLSNASELQRFQVELNNLTGKVSGNFGGLQKLEGFVLYENNLGSGDADEMNFFQSLVNCSRLQVLLLMANQFEVYKGILGEDRTIVAIKVLNIQRQGASRSFISECEALKNIRHRNLVKVISSCSSVDFRGNDFKALVYEFMPNGSLENWLHMDMEMNITQVEIRNLNILQRTNIAIDVACALDYLHHHCPMPIVHCDIKPSNILFDCDMIAHVGDFGLAKFLLRPTNSKESSSIGIRGTIGYTPPEYGLGSEVSTKGDVYSYGILLLEMITGKRPTDSVFEGGLNLHNYASMALLDGVTEVVDPKLLNNVDEVLGNHNGSLANKIKECLISMVKVGVACSMELPQERWDISKAISKLQLVRDIILGARI